MSTASISLPLDPPVPTASRSTERGTAGSGRGWAFYLILAALLVPVLQPTVPKAQFVILDGLNLLAMVVFGCVALARRPRIHLPLIVPVVIIAVGSLLAATNANSYSKVALTLIQDTYLYLWFLFLVSILEGGDQRVVRNAWMWSANIAGAIGLFLLLTDGTMTFGKIFGARGNRAVGLFNGPNELADYLMMSLFVSASLSGQLKGFLVWGSFLFQLLVLVATKSNGAMSSWLIGMTVWGLVRATCRSASVLAVTAITLVLGGTLLFGWWVGTEWNLGASFAAIGKQSFMGRLETSAEGREVIWHRLIQRYEEFPLGIGPGNSSEQHLSVGHRERRKSHKSKEAHNDYLGYLVERGPLGLVGLVFLVILPFVAVWTGFRKVADRAWRAGTGGAIAAALAGGLVATTVHSLTMEKLHFRHYWLFLAIVFAFSVTPGPRLALAGVRRRQRRPQARHAAHPYAARRPQHPAAHGNGSGPEES